MSNNFDREIAAEDEATFRSLFKPMKNFFEKYDFIDKYGNYPQFWQDLKKWDHYTYIKKIYMIYTDQILSGIENPDIQKIQDKIEAKKKQQEEDEIQQQQQQQQQLDTRETNKSIDDKTTVRTKRKKRSRWDDVPVKNTSAIITDNNNNVESEVKEENNNNNSIIAQESTTTPGGRGKPRRRTTTKWSTVDTMLAYFVSSSPSSSSSSSKSNQGDSTQAIQQLLILQLQLKGVMSKLKTVAEDAAWLDDKIKEDPDYPREPSPPPEYDDSGKRLNTREVRMKSKLNRERVKYVDSLMKLNPLFQPPADLTREKPKRKIYIPVKDNPNFNYVGLIIGPRGATQKEMESNYNCKISIRGKGTTMSEKQKNLPGMDDELHVLVTGETEDNVNAASIRVQELLKPVADEDNEFKKAQLRQLASIQGTLREDYCPLCGEKGHRQFECPHRKKSFALADVKCSICGDKSHPTRDCPMRNKAGIESGTLENEYNSFLDELTGGGDNNGNRNAGSGSGINTNTNIMNESTNGVTTSDDENKPKQVIIEADMVTGFEGLESKDKDEGKNEGDVDPKEKDNDNSVNATATTVPPPAPPPAPSPPVRPQTVPSQPVPLQSQPTGSTVPTSMDPATMAIYQQYLHDPVYIAYANYGYDPATAMQYTQAYYYHYGGQQKQQPFNHPPPSS